MTTTKKHFMLSLDEDLVSEWKKKRKISNLSGAVEWLIRQDLEKAKKNKVLPEGVEEVEVIDGVEYWKIEGIGWLPRYQARLELACRKKKI